jgi:ethanolaminephosphotransferase
VDDRVELMLRNAQQLLTIVRAAYPDFGSKGTLEDCSAAGTDVDELACWWRKSLEANKHSLSNGIDHTITLGLLSKFSTRCQDFLSMAASNYNLNWMSTGIVVTFLAFVLSVFSFVPLLESSRLANSFFPIILLTYGIMMFASSYVEEEHHFWYWVASGWFIALFIKGYVTLTYYLAQGH